MTEVFERVLLGNRHDACDVSLFNQQNIGLVVNATDNIGNHFEGCSQVKRRVPKHQQTEEMISLSQSSVGEVIFDEEGRNVTPTKQSQGSLSLENHPILFDDESDSSMCETPSLRGETLYSTTTEVTDYLAIPSQVSDNSSSDLSSIPSDPMLTFDDENSIMSSVSVTESDNNNNNLIMMDDQNSLSSISIRDEASNTSETPQKSQDESSGFATPKSKSKKSTPRKSSQKKERKQVAKVYEYVKLNHSVMYHKIAIEDSHEVNIVDYFDEAVSKVENFLANHPTMKVMIHCREGKSRSVSTLIAYGMKHLKLSLHDCYNHVTKKLRGNDRINDGFKRQLMEYELDLLRARSAEDPEIVIENSLNFFQKRGRHTKSYALNVDHDDDNDDVDYDEEDDGAEEDDDDDEDDGDYSEEKKKKKKKKTGGRKKKGTQFSKDWKDIEFEETKPQKGKQLSLFDMFAKKNKPAVSEPVQQPGSKQATLDSLFSPKKPKKNSARKQSSAKKLNFDDLPQEATLPEVVVVAPPIDDTNTSSGVAVVDNMDITSDVKELEMTLESKPEVKEGKKKKKEKDQNKTTKKVFKRAPRFPTPVEEPVVVQPEASSETKKRKKTETSKDSKSSGQSKKKKSKKEKKTQETTESIILPSSDEVVVDNTESVTVASTTETTTEQAPIEEKSKKVEKPKTGGLFKYFKPKSTTTTA